MTDEFTRFIRESPKVRADYVKKLIAIHKGKHVRIGSVENFKRRYRLR